MSDPHPMAEKAFAYFSSHWHIAFAGAGDTADLLSVKLNTMKTRIARGQAMSMRDADGQPSRSIRFTGYHLVFNLLKDRLIRYGFSTDEASDFTIHTYAEWVLNNVLAGPHKGDAILRAMQDEDGKAQLMLFQDGDVEDWTGDAALIIPIGTMVQRMAFKLYARTNDPAMFDYLKR